MAVPNVCWYTLIRNLRSFITLSTSRAVHSLRWKHVHRGRSCLSYDIDSRIMWRKHVKVHLYCNDPSYHKHNLSVIDRNNDVHSGREERTKYKLQRTNWPLCPVQLDMCLTISLDHVAHFSWLLSLCKVSSPSSSPPYPAAFSHLLIKTFMNLLPCRNIVKSREIHNTPIFLLNTVPLLMSLHIDKKSPTFERYCIGSG